MIKFIFAGVWICAVTIGSMYFAFSAAAPVSAKAEKPAFYGGLDYIKTNVISVPVVHDQRIDGYFLTRLVYTVEPEKVKKLSIPAEILLTDQVYTYLYANPQIDFAASGGIDLDAFRAGLRDSINARVGDQLIHEIMVEQIDFLTKAEIRDNTIRRKAQSINAEAEWLSDAKE